MSILAIRPVLCQQQSIHILVFQVGSQVFYCFFIWNFIVQFYCVIVNFLFVKLTWTDFLSFTLIRHCLIYRCMSSIAPWRFVVFSSMVFPTLGASLMFYLTRVSGICIQQVKYWSYQAVLGYPYCFKFRVLVFLCNSKCTLDDV